MEKVKEAPRSKTETVQEPAKTTERRAEREERRAEGLARRVSSLASRGGSPFAFIRRFAGEMERLCEDLGVAPGLLKSGATAVDAEWSPQIDVKEREGQLVVRADLPGLTRDDITVELTDDVLTIQGERKEEKKEEREGYFYSERSHGRFFRAVPLPEGADPTKATAAFQNGVLEVSIALPPAATPTARRLEVHEKK